MRSSDLLCTHLLLVYLFRIICFSLFLGSFIWLVGIFFFPSKRSALTFHICVCVFLPVKCRICHHVYASFLVELLSTQIVVLYFVYILNWMNNFNHDDDKPHKIIVFLFFFFRFPIGDGDCELNLFVRLVLKCNCFV